MVPQVFAVMLKSPGSAPVSMGVCSVAGLPPVFEIVMFCAGAVWLTSVAAKVRVSGVSTMEAGAVPLPVSSTTAWPPPAMSA